MTDGKTPGGGADHLLEVQDLKVHFRLPRRNVLTPGGTVHAVDGISYRVRRGSTFGIVGESGSGKTTAALAAMRLVPVTGGSIRLDGVEMTTLGGDALREVRRKIQIVFQDPYSSLNPRMRAGAIVREPMDLMEVGDPAGAGPSRRRAFRPRRPQARTGGALPAPVLRRPAPANRRRAGAGDAAGADRLRRSPSPPSMSRSRRRS